MSHRADLCRRTGIHNERAWVEPTFWTNQLMVACWSWWLWLFGISNWLNSKISKFWMEIPGTSFLDPPIWKVLGTTCRSRCRVDTPNNHHERKRQHGIAQVHSGQIVSNGNWYLSTSEAVYLKFVWRYNALLQGDREIEIKKHWTMVGDSLSYYTFYVSYL